MAPPAAAPPAVARPAVAPARRPGVGCLIWTGNKVGGCSGPISMWCQGAIPCNELYETSCAQGDQTRVEVTCFQ